MIETKLYIGLNDADTHRQEFKTEQYVDVLKNVCITYQTPFSLDIQQGGYIHVDGTYTEEATLVLSILDAQQETVNAIARDLCAYFHQESILITEDHVRSYFVTEGE